jgi:hypothetical protein
MNNTSYANNALSPSKHDVCIQQAGIDYGIAHCLDGTTYSFVDDYPRKLRAAVKLTAQIFNGRRMFLSEQELDNQIGRLKVCRDLPSPDCDLAPVIDVLLRNLLPSRFNQLVGTMADCREMDLSIRDLFERVRDQGERTQAIARAIQWQRKSDADSMTAKHTVEAAFSGNEPVFAHKVALLRKTFVPANEAAAYSLHERAKGNERLLQQEMSGEKVPHKPDILHRPHIALIENDMHTLQAGLDSAVSVKDLLRGGVITVNFSRVHGLYLGAVFLVDSRRITALKDLADEVNGLWDEVTDGDGHTHHWREPQCSWCGLIEPNDIAKKASLLLELECRALREKYVRAKGAEVLPTFTPILSAMVGAQRGEDHYA